MHRRTIRAAITKLLAAGGYKRRRKNKCTRPSLIHELVKKDNNPSNAHLMRTPITIHNVKLHALIDTGAAASFLSVEFLRKFYLVRQ